MSMNDPVADMLTRIRNGVQAKHDDVAIPFSKFKEAIANLLNKEGFVSGVEVKGDGAKKAIIITLKYTAEREPVFVDLQRASKMGRRVYQSSKKIIPLRQGAGISIISTPKGLMKDVDAKTAGVGGEVVCTIW